MIETIWRFLVKHILSLGLGILLFALVGFVAPTQRVAAADVGVQPAEGPQGTTFSFTANGFKPNEKVSFWTGPVDSPPTDNGLRNHDADENGRVNWTWTAPSDATFGTWTMVAFGTESRSAQTITFTIIRPDNAPPPPPPSSSVNPEEGTFGTVFSFTASGFAAGEKVSFWASSPNGAAVGPAMTTADDKGNAAWKWTAPTADDANATPGKWLMAAYGNTSQIQSVTYFIIDKPVDTTGPIITSVQPTQGAPGTTFTFTANGFAKDEKVSFWLAGPDKSITSDNDTYRTTADKNGVATWKWTAPQDALPGTWTMVGFGVQSQKGQQIPFTISSQ